MTRQGPLRAEDRRPAARLRQDHHAGARGGQGDQAADHLRPHRAHRHALRGAQARRRDRDAARHARARGEADDAASEQRAREDFEAKIAPARRRPRVPAPHQHRRRAHERRGPGARRAHRRSTRWTRPRGRDRALPHRATRTTNLTIRAGTLNARGARDHQPPHRRRPSRCSRRCRGRSTCVNVPEYAGGHHERMDGKGYPRGLTREQMSRAGAHHGHRRHLRGADRQGPALQAGQDALRVARHPRQVQGERPHRPGSLRHLRARTGLPALRAASSSTPSRSTRWTSRGSRAPRASGTKLASSGKPNLPFLSPASIHDDTLARQRLLRAFHHLRLRRAHLPVHLEPLPQALPRARGLRADAGAGDLHGRHGARLVAREPLHGPDREPAPGLRLRGAGNRAPRDRLPRACSSRPRAGRSTPSCPRWGAPSRSTSSSGRSPPSSSSPPRCCWERPSRS